MAREVLKRMGKPLKLTEEEEELLDDLWEAGYEVNRLEVALIEARARRDTLIREAKARRFLNREISEIASVSPASVHYIVQET